MLLNFLLLILYENVFKQVHAITTIGEETFELIQTSNESHALCACWKETYEVSDMVCKCSGEEMTEIPNNLPYDVTQLIIINSGLKKLKAKCFQPYRKTLTEITLRNIPSLKEIEAGVFENLLELLTIYFQNIPLLRQLPENLFSVYLPKLKVLRILNCGIIQLPKLNKLRTDSLIRTIDLENNLITSISENEINIQAEELFLSYNQIHSITKGSFNGSEIATLSLKGNYQLNNLHLEAFQGLQSLRSLDLSETKISKLPTEGLHDIEILRIQDTELLTEFPLVYNFTYIKEAWLTYPCHCCAFKYPQKHDPHYYMKERDFAIKMAKLCETKNTNELQWHKTNISYNNMSALSMLNYGTIDGIWGNIDQIFHSVDFDIKRTHPLAIYCGNISKNYQQVTCYPKPDAFNPCEDLMGTWWLRISVWIVALLAIFGNTAVACVLITSRFRMTVTRFLICNLSIADGCIGIYLLLLAIADSRSIGEYFNYAISWQNGYGCQIAGFLTIFGNVLSIYTLAVITCERWYTIVWAIHLNRRLNLRSAIKIMFFGWCFALVMAILPINGISDYSRTSICLPLEHRQTADMAYLSTLLSFNFFAFFIICIGYARMYCSIKGDAQGIISTTASRSDFTVAKRMALLVFTDFACLAPIGFFSMTALAGHPLITVTQTKILLVFIYPINSCANPYLYALLTHQYRRDLYILLGRYGICKEKADQCKGAIGGKPLPKGSGGQYRRPCGGDSVNSRTNNRACIENHHNCSVKSSRLSSITVVPETVTLHTIKDNCHYYRDMDHVCNPSSFRNKGSVKSASDAL